MLPDFINTVTFVLKRPFILFHPNGPCQGYKARTANLHINFNFLLLCLKVHLMIINSAHLLGKAPTTPKHFKDPHPHIINKVAMQQNVVHVFYGPFTQNAPRRRKVHERPPHFIMSQVFTFPKDASHAKTLILEGTLLF